MRSLLYRIFPLSGWPVAVLVILSQILSSYLVNILSYNALYKLYPYFRLHKVEQNGDIYQKLFRIRSWKEGTWRDFFRRGWESRYARSTI